MKPLCFFLGHLREYGPWLIAKLQTIGDKKMGLLVVVNEVVTAYTCLYKFVSGVIIAPISGDDAF